MNDYKKFAEENHVVFSSFDEANDHIYNQYQSEIDKLKPALWFVDQDARFPLPTDEVKTMLETTCKGREEFKELQGDERYLAMANACYSVATLEHGCELNNGNYTIATMKAVRDFRSYIYGLKRLEHDELFALNSLIEQENLELKFPIQMVLAGLKVVWEKHPKKIKTSNNKGMMNNLYSFVYWMVKDNKDNTIKMINQLNAAFGEQPHGIN
ncbi:hypothetical protein ACB087_01990 [Vibrio sp. VNB-15]